MTIRCGSDSGSDSDRKAREDFAALTTQIAQTPQSQIETLEKLIHKRCDALFALNQISAVICDTNRLIAMRPTAIAFQKRAEALLLAERFQDAYVDFSHANSLFLANQGGAPPVELSQQLSATKEALISRSLPLPTTPSSSPNAMMMMMVSSKKQKIRKCFKVNDLVAIRNESQQKFLEAKILQLSGGNALIRYVCANNNAVENVHERQLYRVKLLIEQYERFCVRDLVCVVWADSGGMGGMGSGGMGSGERVYTAKECIVVDVIPEMCHYELLFADSPLIWTYQFQQVLTLADAESAFAEFDSITLKEYSKPIKSALVPSRAIHPLRFAPPLFDTSSPIIVPQTAAVPVFATATTSPPVPVAVMSSAGVPTTTAPSSSSSSETSSTSGNSESSKKMKRLLKEVQPEVIIVETDASKSGKRTSLRLQAQQTATATTTAPYFIYLK